MTQERADQSILARARYNPQLTMIHDVRHERCWHLRRIEQAFGFRLAVAPFVLRLGVLNHCEYHMLL
jgi:hypothetical protein